MGNKLSSEEKWKVTTRMVGEFSKTNEKITRKKLFKKITDAGGSLRLGLTGQSITELLEENEKDGYVIYYPTFSKNEGGTYVFLNKPAKDEKMIKEADEKKAIAYTIITTHLRSGKFFDLVEVKEEIESQGGSMNFHADTWGQLFLADGRHYTLWNLFINLERIGIVEKHENKYRGNFQFFM